MRLYRHLMYSIHTAPISCPDFCRARGSREGPGVFEEDVGTPAVKQSVCRSVCGFPGENETIKIGLSCSLWFPFFKAVSCKMGPCGNAFGVCKKRPWPFGAINEMGNCHKLLQVEGLQTRGIQQHFKGTFTLSAHFSPRKSLDLPVEMWLP